MRKDSFLKGRHGCGQGYDGETVAAMKRATEYFGEDWDANDPSRVMRIVRDFMNLFDKSMAEIEARPPKSQIFLPSTPVFCHFGKPLCAVCSSWCAGRLLTVRGIPAFVLFFMSACSLHALPCESLCDRHFTCLCAYAHFLLRFVVHSANVPPLRNIKCTGIYKI